MLNAMFNELERTHVAEALEDCEDKGAEGAEDSTDHISPIMRDGGEIKVQDLLEAVQKGGESKKVGARRPFHKCYFRCSVNCCAVPLEGVWQHHR